MFEKFRNRYALFRILKFELRSEQIFYLLPFERYLGMKTENHTSSILVNRSHKKVINEKCKLTLPYLGNEHIQRSRVFTKF